MMSYSKLFEAAEQGDNIEAILQALNTEKLWDAMDDVLDIATRQNNVHLYKAVVQDRLRNSPEEPIFGMETWDSALKYARLYRTMDIVNILLDTVHANESSVDALLFEIGRPYWRDVFPETYRVMYQLWCDAPPEVKEACLAKKRESRHWGMWDDALAQVRAWALDLGKKHMALDFQ